MSTPLLTIQSDCTSAEAAEWLKDLVILILEYIDVEEEIADTITYEVESLSYKDVDTIFGHAVAWLTQ